MKFADIVRNRKAKLCPRCGKVKPIESFYADSTRADGKDGICKPCKRVSLRKCARKRRLRERKERMEQEALNAAAGE